jgi:hypothetical protein
LFFRAEVLSRRHGRWKTIVRSYKQAEQLYVAALESLEEALVDYPVIYEWLDRHVSFDHHDCNVSPDPDGVPRLINSLSQFNARTPTNKKRKREFLLSVLQDSLYQLEHGITLAIQNRAKDRDDRLSQLCNGIDLNEEPTFEYEV